MARYFFPRLVDLEVQGPAAHPFGAVVPEEGVVTERVIALVVIFPS